MQLRRSHTPQHLAVAALTSALICAQPLAADAEETPTPEPTTQCIANADSLGVQLPEATLKVHGTVTDCGEGRLRLELSSAGGTWDHHSAVSTTGDGAFSFSIAPADTRVGTRVGTYRWRVIGEFDGRTTTLDQDDVLRVGVMRAHNAGSKFAGERTNAWGVFPGATNAPIRSEIFVNGAWRVIDRARTTASGSFVIATNHAADRASRQRWRVVAELPGAVEHASHDMVLTRQALPSAASAGNKRIGEGTNTWGVISGGPSQRVWTEVYVGGKWFTSQIRTTDAQGRFVIPLTYGFNTVGKYRYRVASLYSNGRVGRSAEFTLTRGPRPIAYSAGTKLYKEGTNTWGWFPGGAGIPVWTEVNVGGRWLKSQEGTAQANGRYVLPLTYGAEKIGLMRWRVAGRYPNGEVVRTNEFTLTRRGFNFSYCARSAAGERYVRATTRNAMRAVCHEFPELERYLGVQSRSYASHHPTEQAFDVMVSGPRGWDLAHMLQRHHKTLGVTEIIYQRRIWTARRAGEGWRWMPSRGNPTADHYDHVHVSTP